MGFSNDFLWGAASASYQIEGAYNEDGKGLNIWDVYSQIPDKVKHCENGNMACDHYHRYKEDVAIMKSMGIKNYRFSLSWARILPDGTGDICEAGLKFYDNLIDELIANGIEPVVTIFHWDYPIALQRQGAWMNDASSDWFLEYTKVVVDRFSDRVKYWLTINEPQCFIGCSYDLGIHAPFTRVPQVELIHMTHNVLLGHGKAVKYIREHAKTKAVIGFAPTAPSIIPASDSEEDIEIARKRTFELGDAFTFSNSWWSDPVFLGKYPDEAYEKFGDMMPHYSEEDMQLISQPLDFYGCNIYYSMAIPNLLTYAENEYIGVTRNDIGWVVTPEVLYWSAKFMYDRYKKPILITENGFSDNDCVSLDGQVHDPQRINYIHRYLLAYKKAADEGIPLMGYFYWSEMDNFEWAEGYDKRFGLVYVDYRTQERIVKDSGWWFKKVIESNGDIL